MDSEITAEQFLAGDLNGDGRVGIGDIGESLKDFGRAIRDGWNNFKDWVGGLFGNKKPLVIDLDEDGIELVGTKAGAAFDWGEDGEDIIHLSKRVLVRNTSQHSLNSCYFLPHLPQLGEAGPFNRV